MELMKWFIGVVEDDNDPEKLGRVRVRIFGKHSDETIEDLERGEGISVENLPWANVVQPNSAGMDGIGMSPTGLVKGTRVFGVSLDDTFYNHLLVLGSLQWMQELEANLKSFRDPDGKYPELKGEISVNRLARNEKISETIVQQKKDTRITGISSYAYSWDEPLPAYQAQYPYNHVYQSKSGHVIEVDDTNGAERLHRWHKSGTYEEWKPDGSSALKIVGSDYQIVVKDRNVLIKGNCHITIEGNSELLVKGNVRQKINGDVQQDINGNVTQNVKGSRNETIDGDLNQTIKGNHSVNVSGSQSLKSSNTTIDGGASVAVKGSTITLN